MKHLFVSLFSLIAFTATSQALPEGSVYQLPSQWQDQNGKTLELKDLGGSPRLLVMLYTRCTTTCPLVLEDIKGVLGELPDGASASLKVALFSFDSERETSSSLKDFFNKKELDARWTLLTGDSSDVATLAGALGVRYKKVGDEYIHSNIIFLVDKDGVVLAKKEGLKTPKADFVREVKSVLAAR